jgi:hypothetical protein
MHEKDKKVVLPVPELLCRYESSKSESKMDEVRPIKKKKISVTASQMMIC